MFALKFFDYEHYLNLRICGDEKCRCSAIIGKTIHLNNPHVCGDEKMEAEANMSDTVYLNPHISGDKEKETEFANLEKLVSQPACLRG